jgi:hypothetical protein
LGVLVLKRPVEMRAADWLILAVFLFERLSFFWSLYPANSLPTDLAVETAILAYFIVRLTGKPILIAVIGGALGLGAACQSVLLISQFAFRARHLRELGLTNLVAFRSGLFHSSSRWSPQELLTALLLSLPFACVSGTYLSHATRKWQATFAFLPVVLVEAALVLSLSRAIFWSLVVFALVSGGLMAGYRVITARAGALMSATVLCVVALVLLCESALYPGILNAYGGGHTSQVRSTKGRRSIWNRSLKLVHQHPFLGIGFSNAALFLQSSSDREETIGFASRAFSLPIQVLVENGIVGFGLYSAFLTMLCYEFHRTMQSEWLKDVRPSGKLSSKGRAGTKRKQDRLRVQTETAHKAMKCFFAAEDNIKVPYRAPTCDGQSAEGAMQVSSSEVARKLFGCRISSTLQHRNSASFE